jgi:hypothetical protein
MRPFKRHSHIWEENDMEDLREVLPNDILEYRVLPSGNTLYVHSEQKHTYNYYYFIIIYIVVVWLCVYFICSSVSAYFIN